MDLQSLMQLGPIPLLALVLNCVGYFLKKSPVNNYWIPWILFFSGGIIYPFIAETSQINHNVAYPIMMEIMIGCAIGALSVFSYDRVSQFIESKFKTDGTQFLKKIDVPKEPAASDPMSR